MVEKVKALLAEYDMAPPGALVLCALSGGADSVCLVHLLCALSARGGFQVAAAHYDHRLRGAESRRDADFVRDWCAGAGIALYTGSGEVAAEAADRGTGLEETARAMRYDFLRATALEIGADRIATAHSADDNLETLLLHLVRGTGLRGLAGIPPRREELVRPLLTTTRREIEEYLTAHNLPHVEDSSNTDERFARNRLRRQVIPVLRQLNPRLTETAAVTARTLRADGDYLTARAVEAAAPARWAGDDLVIEARHIAGQPAAIAPRVVRCLLERMAGPGAVGSVHLEAVVELARGEDPSAVLHLPGGLLVQRVYREVLFTADAHPLPPFSPLPLAREGVTAVPGTRWRAACRSCTTPQSLPRDPGHFYLRQTRDDPPLLLRPRQPGDGVTLPHRGLKPVKKLFIDAKVPRREREQVPILVRGDRVLAVAGFGPAEDELAKPGQSAWEITIWKDGEQ